MMYAFAEASAIRPVASLEDLMIAVARGDQAAFRRLYEASSARIFPICLKMLRDREVASEVFQEAFFRIWQKAHLFDRSKGSALGWMATIARRCALDRLAKIPRNTVSIDDIEEGFVANAASRLGGSLESIRLKRCLQQLDEKYSEAILLAYFYGLTHEELAAKLNIPLGTAKSRVRRGLAQLHGLMAIE